MREAKKAKRSTSIIVELIAMGARVVTVHACESRGGWDENLTLQVEITVVAISCSMATSPNATFLRIDSAHTIIYVLIRAIFVLRR